MKKKIMSVFLAIVVSLSMNASIVGAACNHVWGSWKVYLEATCTQDGEMYRECSECWDEETKIIPATGIHTWTAWEADSYLCEDGKYTRYCTQCYKEETKARQGDGSHLWSNWTSWDESDCLNKGSERRYCYNCYTYEYRDIPVDTNAHQWGSWYNYKSPTISKNGKAERMCYVCKKTEIKETPKLKASVTLSVKKKKLKKGKSFVLKVKKKTAGDKVIKFSSNNKKVATVNKKGKISAKKKGKTVITVTMKSGCKAKCTVTVK